MKLKRKPGKFAPLNLTWAMKTFTGDHVLSFSWQQVATAFWQRYPNPFARHVLSEDTIWRSVSDSTIHTIRLLRKTNRLPKWGERFAPSHKEIMILEESVLDRRSKNLTTLTRNVDAGSTKVMVVDEQCTYSAATHKGCGCELTLVRRNAQIRSPLFGVHYLLEQFGKERFKSNVVNANKGFEHVLAQLFPPAPTCGSRHSELKNNKMKDQVNKAKDAVKKGAHSLREKCSI